MSQSLTSIATSRLRGVLIGVVLGNILIGVATTQFYTYRRKYKRDTIAVKLLVYVCALLNAAHAALECFNIYLAGVTGFGNLEITRASRDTAVVASIPIAILVALLVQLYFARRVEILTGRLWVLIAVAALSLAQTALCIRLVMASIHGSGYSVPYVVPRICIEMSINLLISSHLVYFFQTRRTGFHNTDDLLKRFTRVTIRTGLAVTIWSIAALCTFFIMGDATYLAFILSGPPFYMITLLSTLNSRSFASVREIRLSSVQVSGSFPLSEGISTMSSQSQSKSQRGFMGRKSG